MNSFLLLLIGWAGISGSYFRIENCFLLLLIGWVGITGSYFRIENWFLPLIYGWAGLMHVLGKRTGFCQSGLTGSCFRIENWFLRLLPGWAGLTPPWTQSSTPAVAKSSEGTYISYITNRKFRFWFPVEWQSATRKSPRFPNIKIFLVDVHTGAYAKWNKILWRCTR